MNRSIAPAFAAQGFKQIAGIDFRETYASTALITSIRVELIKTCAQGWEIHYTTCHSIGVG